MLCLHLTSQFNLLSRGISPCAVRKSQLSPASDDSQAKGTSQDMPDIPVQAGKPDQLEDAMLLAKDFSLLDVLLVILAPVNKIARILACRSLLSKEGNYRTMLWFYAKGLIAAT